VRCGLSSVYGFRRGLELGVLGDGGSGWLKSVSLAQKLIIIESACAQQWMTRFYMNNSKNLLLTYS